MASPVTRDLRRYDRQTRRRLLLGFIALTYLLGGGLIYVIYGREAALLGVVCITMGLAPLGLTWLLLTALGWIARRANDDR